MIRKFAKYWRDSASLLVLAKDQAQPNPLTKTYNYKVLVFKRTAKTAFMPNSVVFPGGGFDKQDASLDWESFFRSRNIPEKALNELTKVGGARPYIFERESTDLLDRNISLRLCALREAFEELGVLLVTNERGKDAGYSSCMQSFDVATWQQRIHDGAVSFQELHAALGSTPDVLNLYEWSCWLTPSMFRKRRYETAFYLAVLNEQPNIHPEPHEVHEYFWDTPAALLEAHREEKIWLAPPQTYEVTRLSYVYDIDQLVRFADGRNRKGSTLLCPVQYNAADGVIFVLPGDELYPPDYDYNSDNPNLDQYGEQTRDAIRSKAKRLHRVEHTDDHPQPDHFVGKDLRKLKQVLVFKRPERTSFMPNAVVFPGGAFDKQDAALAWNSLLPKTITTPLAHVSGPRPFIFETESEEVLNRNVSLRLCAIREAFEELGILLAAKMEHEPRKLPGYGSVIECGSSDLVSWQKDVHDGRKQFQELCQHLAAIPDVASLYEWSTWITPTILHKKRFETAFFLVALDALPTVLPEPKEVQEYFWDTPGNLLEAHEANRIWLTPPQAYELKRLSYLPDIEQVISFARSKRIGKGTTPLCPVAYRTADGVVLALPGDTLYPKDYDYVTEHSNANDYVSLTLKELRQKAASLHRLELVGKLHAKGFHQNHPALDEHLHLEGDHPHLGKL
uniref:Nudix hydrolase domain-containing protein n=1 Tax=Anopheles dirus TaxID=7168 RepID=A0A182NAU3_9DIPT